MADNGNYDNDIEDKLKLLGLNVPAEQPQYSSMDNEIMSPAPTANSSNDDRLQGLLSGAIKPENDQDSQMLKDYLGGDQSAPDSNQQFPEPRPASSLPQKPVQQAAPSNVPQESAPMQAPAVSAPNQPAPAQKNPLENPELNDEAIKQAQQVGENRRLIAGIGEAGGRFAATAGGGKFDDSYYKRLQEGADQSVENIKTRRDAVTKNMLMANTLVELATKNMDLDRSKRLQDPNSSESTAIRAMVTKYEPNLAKDPNFQKMSGQDVKDFMLHFLESEGRIQANKAAKEASQANKAEQQGHKETESRFKYLDDTTNPFKARAGLLADAQKNKQNVERLQGLVERDEHGNFNLTKPESEEFSLGIARVLAGSTPTSRAQVEAIVPNTGRGRIQDVKSWLLNKPEGREQQDFIKRMYNTALTEKSVAEQQVKRAQLENFFAQGDLRDQNSDRFEQKLNSRGLTMNDYDSFVEARKQGKGTDIDFNKTREAVQNDRLIGKGSSNAQPSNNKPTNGMTRIQASDGSLHDIPTQNLDKAKQRDPSLKVLQ